MSTTPVRDALFDLAHAGYEDRQPYRAFALHPEVMADLLRELHTVDAGRRTASGPFSELPGEPSHVLILDTPAGQVRVHACRDVSARGVSGYRLGLGWGSRSLPPSSAEESAG